MRQVVRLAREDLRRASRSRLLWGAVALLCVMFLPSTGASARPGIHPIGEYLLVVVLDLMTFSLVVVVAAGASAVAGEQVSGTIRFVLGLPVTRRDLVVGKLLSRTGIVVLAVVIVLGVANVVVLQGYGGAYLLRFWTMGAWMVAYVVVWSAVTVGYSAAVGSSYRAVAGVAVTYVGFSLNFGVWDVLVRPVFAFVFTGSLSSPSYGTLSSAPLWLRATERLNPLIDFWAAMRWSVEAVGPGTPTGDPLANFLGTLVFLSFGAVPLVVGLGRFRARDLGDDDRESELGHALRGLRVRLIPDSPRFGARVGRTGLLALADARRAVGSRVVTGALVIVVLLAGPDLWSGIDTSGITTTEVLGDIGPTFALPVLALGIAVGHNTVVGERVAGTARLVLGLPVTRRDLLVGKLCSRVGLAVATLVPLFLFAEVLVVARLGGVYPGAMIAWAGWVLLFAIVWTGFAVGVSAATSTRYRSLAAIFGTYLLFGRDVGLWDPLIRPAIGFAFTGEFSASGYAYGADAPAWFRYPDHLNPFVALGTVREGLLELTGYGTDFTTLVVPLFLYSGAVLLAFPSVAVLIGARRFDDCELG